jgi:uncharacterized membrane protein/uncharacterized membrane protein YeaQ/YmgE (transglycosylase-associated protein family)
MQDALQQLGVWLAIGLGAGIVARRTLRSPDDYGLLGDLTVGCLGAVLGGWVMRKTGIIAPANLIGHGFTALIGAASLVASVRGVRWLFASVSRNSALRRQLTATAVGLRARVTPKLDPNQAFDVQLTLGERIADRVAAFGGSWTFIGLFLLSMACWMALNEEITRPFDPFPFILLNLILSCLAAIQAPVIMMSQNRQAAKDRLDARLDYEVNLQAEAEVRALHAKLDALQRTDPEQLAARMDDLAERLARLETLVTRISDSAPGGTR